MILKEKTCLTSAVNGEVQSVTWSQPVLHAMLRPQRSLVKIPNPQWEKLTFPFNLQEEVVNHSAARITFQIFIPTYKSETRAKICNGLQEIAYNADQNAEMHQKAALKSLIKNIANTSPQFPLGNDLVSISGYEKAYQQAVRFTRWSTFPCEFVQIRILWDDLARPEQRIIETEVTMLFDQQKISPEMSFKVNKRGVLDLKLGNWIPGFDLKKLQMDEIPDMDVIKTPPIDVSSSSENTPSPAPKEPPRKKVRLTNRFAISSDEEM